MDEINGKSDAMFDSFKEDKDPASVNEDFVPTPMTSEEKDFLLSQLNVGV